MNEDRKCICKKRAGVGRPPLESVYWSFIICITARDVREKLEEIAKRDFIGRLEFIS